MGKEKLSHIRPKIEYDTIVRAAMDGFLLLDMDGHIVDVNDAYCQLIGYSRDELINMGISDVEAQEALEDVAARIEKVRKNGSDRFETKHRRKDGQI
ncbi:MAG TPA: PAS domain S-box protein, partial [Actinobacteria bacterium]|nr:PAS domain S-box protein [Actinomycetota bacterium]